nr:TatD family hydrolase [Propionibacterium sp.]
MSGKRAPLPEPLPLPVTDAHTHLESTTVKGGLPAAEAVPLAASVNVTRLVDVGCDVVSSREAIGNAENHPAVIATVALHPNDAGRAGASLDDQLRGIEALVTASDRVRAVGETGLDFYRTRDADAQAAQRVSFAAHIAFAKAFGRALVIHDRDAHDAILDVLDAEGWPERVQFHCFSGDVAFARRCLAHDAFLSFPGTVTYPANDALREALRFTPRDRLLVETDAPYLTPVPFRGRVNSAYLVPVTVRAMAAERGEDLETLCEALQANASALFGDWGHDG